jgi:hypothetical protein
MRDIEDMPLGQNKGQAFMREVVANNHKMMQTNQNLYTGSLIVLIFINRIVVSARKIPSGGEGGAQIKSIHPIFRTNLCVKPAQDAVWLDAYTPH